MHRVQLIRNSYDGQEACVRTKKGNTSWFTLAQSVRQGCILSLSLFNIYAEYIMMRALDGWRGGISFSGRLLSNLWYADDTTLLSTSLDDMKELLKE
jgi:hypothetical protein